MSKPKAAVRAEFARRLNKELSEHGWTQADLARRASLFMKNKETGETQEMGRDNINNYVNEKALPNAMRLHALAKAFGCDVTDLLPERGARSDNNAGTNAIVKEIENGRAWIIANQETSWDKALKVMQILKGTDDAD